MKPRTVALSLTLFCALWIASFLPGCSTAQQRTGYNTIATLEASATAAVDGYFLLVVKGVVPTNGVPVVSKDYNLFQGGAKVAVDLVQNNTNALAPASLQQLFNDLSADITLYRGGK